MIKDFSTYINEDYFSKLASRKDIGSVRKENEITITEDDVLDCIIPQLRKNVKSISFRKENGETFVDIVGNAYLIQGIEEIPFQFGKVTGDFICSQTYLKSLKGCPTYVSGNFNCACCRNLKSLEGCPKKVGGDFWCYGGPTRFTKEEVKSLCDVKGKILV